MNQKHNLVPFILIRMLVITLSWLNADVDARAQIAYESKKRGNREVYAMDAKEQYPRNLTNNLANDWQPSWSPSGAQLAFTSDREGTLKSMSWILMGWESLKLDQ